jgi:hypothetical protein
MARYVSPHYKQALPVTNTDPVLVPVVGPLRDAIMRYTTIPIASTMSRIASLVGIWMYRWDDPTFARFLRDRILAVRNIALYVGETLPAPNPSSFERCPPGTGRRAAFFTNEESSIVGGSCRSHRGER